jgi:Reverse transcriptase (RNA-dependent DNA polymerase)
MICFGIPRKLVSLTRGCVEGSWSTVRVFSHNSREFGVNTGLRQGDPLSPLLFNLALEKVMNNLRREMSSGFAARGAKLLFAFADDVDAITNTPRDMNEIFYLFDQGAREMGLRVNEEKTKYMVLSRNPRNRVRQNVYLADYNIENVKQFKYLGAIIKNDNSFSEELKARISSGNRSYFALAGLFRSKQLSWDVKIKIYKTIFRPVVTYGCETWTLTKKDETTLLVFERSMLRRIFGACVDTISVEWRRRTNRELEELYGPENILRLIKSLRIQWAGHVVRADQSRMIKTIYSDKMEGRRPPGRPRTRWKDNIDRDLNKIGIVDWERVALDRQTWRGIVVAAKTHPEL